VTRYRTIVADPPWHVTRLASPGAKAFGTQREVLRSIPLPYPTLSVAEIAALPVRDFAEDDSHLYLWTINRYARDAYGIAEAWGFTPKTLLVWSKAPMGLGPGGTFSITTEFVLHATRGALQPFKRIDRTCWSWPRGAHSAKPEAFLDVVEQVSPGPYLELFARCNRLGWDTWGNECLDSGVAL
jgi:N6-adenosine-specific RNA methylase IME4